VTTPADLGAGALRAAFRPAAAGLSALRGVASSVLYATDAPDVLRNSPDGWEVDQPWLWWTGAAGGGRTTFGNPIPGADPWVQFGGIPAVARCTSIIVDTLAALPWHLYRQPPGAQSQQLPTPDWITDPQALRYDGRVLNPKTPDENRWSAMDVWSQWLLSALWFGDAYLWVPRRDSDGVPQPPLYVLHPSKVHAEGGRYLVDVQQGEPYVMGIGEIIHLRGLEPLVGAEARGSGALTRFASTLGYGQSLAGYAQDIFTSGVPAGYLKANQPHLSQEDADTLKAKWMEQHGNGSRSIAVLNATTEFFPLTFTPVDAELIGAGQEFDRHVAMAFGVPAYMLGVPGDSSTYANVESRMIELARFTLLPWAARIEAVLSAQLPRFTSLKIALDALMRADTATRYASYASALGAGWLTVDEVRALEDRPPLQPQEVIA
jgi:HK97 family phage portal protein